MPANIKVIGGGKASEAQSRAHIDPSAAIHPTAIIGPECVIGPFAVVGPDVSLGPRCTVHAHAVLQGPTVLEEENVVHPFACIGGPPQDLRYRGEETSLHIGSGNEFREHVTVNRGTEHGGGATIIGDHNLLMAYCHVAHDCKIGNHVVMANHATLAGHAVVEDHVVFGGMVAVGTFLRIGESAMLAAGSMVEREVPPFCIVAGDRARLRALNRVGLDRRDIDSEARIQIRAIFRALKERGRPVESIIRTFERSQNLSMEATRMLRFLKEVRRGLTR
ncbi:MAG: acyl-ACP--UDP-N-acetylglucosamine O-acyltransferase [Deltaproteobacteria bacterium]|nr:acyl-ACP--UDP-N-acetylglucosamine O-acyltransferase [Deltaproteobacteria bacterium]